MGFTPGQVVAPLFNYRGLARLPVRAPLPNPFAWLRRTFDLVRVTDQLRVERNFKQSMLDSSMDAIIVINLRSVVVEWNRQAELVFGYTRREALGRSMVEMIIPPEQHNAHRRGMSHFLRTGSGPIINRRIHVTAIRRNGHRFPAELSVTPIENYGQLFFASSIRDITQRTELQQYQQLVVQELSYRVGNTLRLIRSITNQMSRPNQDPHRALTTMNGRIDCLIRTADLLNETNWQLVSMRMLLRRGLEAAPVEQQRRCLIASLDWQLPPRDAVNFAMCIHELLTNAQYHGAFASETGYVTISWRKILFRGKHHYDWCWKEWGGVPVKRLPRPGYGLRFISEAIPRETGATVNVETTSEGLCCRVLIPARNTDPNRD